jgi:hypothetical protein
VPGLRKEEAVTQAGRFTKEQMLAWLDETIRDEAGSDACFPNQKFPDPTIAKQIREIVAGCCILDNAP